jgi:hypothetical protein
MAVRCELRAISCASSDTTAAVAVAASELFTELCDRKQRYVAVPFLAVQRRHAV